MLVSAHFQKIKLHVNLKSLKTFYASVSENFKTKHPKAKLKNL